jgi:hypothetical protein
MEQQMSKETAVKIKKGEKAATELNQAADRPERPNPSNREEIKYIAVPAHGVESPDFTPDQTTRSHSEAKDSAAKSQGAIACDEPGMDNAKRRFAAIHQRRKETEKAFDALRPTVAGTRKRLGR